MIPAGDELARAAWAQLWQVTLLIVAVALLGRLLSRNRPHLAHALWLVVLVKCLTPPLWCSPSGIFCWMQATPRGQSTEVVPVARVGEGDDLALRLSPLGTTSGNDHLAFPPAQMELATIPSPAEARGHAMPADQGLEPLPSGPRGWPGTGALFAAWVLGTLGFSAFGVCRWAGCMRVIRRARREVDPSHQLLVARLSRRLGLRRPARLVVTAGRVGPAVMGLVRPTVLLPETILLGRSDADLEPLLAHELIHVRRGDLWVGSLQVLAQAVWWFHPLVWWAGRLTSREAERCCDEAVVAELGCRPARYARALLDVLERKRALKPLPALPGVRPVDVTSKRLERIMKLGQGSRKRSPWWCWAVMLAVAVLTLPGAALVVAAADGQESAASSASDASVVEPLQPVDETPQGDWEALSTLRITWKNLTGTLGNGQLPRSAEKEPLSGAASIQPSPLHVQVDNPLPRMRAAAGYDLIAIRAHFVTCQQKTVESLGANWTVLPSGDPDARTGREILSSPPVDPPLSSAGRSRSQTVIERNLPVMYEVVDDQRADAILDRIRSDRRANVFAAPAVAMFSGRQGFIADCSQRPFVVGLDQGQPQVRVVEEGLRVQLSPAFSGGYDKVKLDCRLRLSNIRDVEVFEFEKADGKPARIQIPEVETTRWEASVEMAVGKTLVIGGLKKRDKDGQPQPMLVLLRPDKMASKQVAAEPQRTYAVVYNVGDLVVELPGQVVVPASYDESPAQTTHQISVHFDPLIELITTTVAPETWEDVGGRGSIKPFPTNLSLVVSQTREVHEQIVDLLGQLRRLRKVQIMLETEVVSVRQDVLQRLGYHFVSGDYAPLTRDQARGLRGGIETSDQASSRRVPKVAVLNGQMAHLAIFPQADKHSAGAGWLWLQPVMSNDRRSVRLTFTVVDENSQAVHRTAVLQDGHSLLVDVTDQVPATDRHVGVLVVPGSRIFRRVTPEPSTERTLVLVTPRIFVQEEEEARLGIVGTP